MIGEKQRAILNTISSRLRQNEGEKNNFFPQLIRTKKNAKLRNTLLCALYIISGFILGNTRLFYDSYVCGIALVLSLEKYAFFAYIGASLSCILRGGGDGTAFFTLGTLALFARGYLSSNRFDEDKKTRLVLSSIIAVICGAVMIIAKNPPLRALTHTVLIPYLTFCFCEVLPKGKDSRHIRQNDSSAVNIALCSVSFLAVYSLAPIRLLVFFPHYILSCVITMSAGYSGSMHKGGFFGMLCGLAGGNPSDILSLGLSGFVSGIFGDKKILYFLSSFFFPLAVSSYLSGTESFYGKAGSALLSVIIFSAIHRFIPERNISFPERKNRGEPEKSLLRLSHTFSSLSDIFHNVSDKLKYPSESEVYRMTDSVLSSFCGMCAMREKCYSRKLYKTENVEDIICTRLMSGGIKKSDLPEKYAESCIRLGEIVEKLNSSYTELVSEHFNNNKTEILASEYSAMARMIKYTSHKTQTDSTPDKALYEKAYSALCSVGLRFSSLSAYGKRIKTLEVCDICLEGFPCTSRELADYLSEKCGVLFGEPSFETRGKHRIMRMTQKRKLRLEYARAACAKGGEGVNGDSVSFFENDEDYFYALISDGMGSGRSAALTSRLTAVFMEKLLTTGAHKNVTLELLNNLLLSKNDESFATVDLLEIDLLCGEASFIKAGAAPAYIVRASKLYKIASQTPPAGILGSFGAESTKFRLEPGDVVLMLSDGILQSSDEIPWLCEMLTFDSTENVSKLANKILTKAKKINLREDDMTCVALRVHEI